MIRRADPGPGAEEGTRGPAGTGRGDRRRRGYDRNGRDRTGSGTSKKGAAVVERTRTDHRRGPVLVDEEELAGARVDAGEPPTTGDQLAHVKGVLLRGDRRTGRIARLPVVDDGPGGLRTDGLHREDLHDVGQRDGPEVDDRRATLGQAERQRVLERGDEGGLGLERRAYDGQNPLGEKAWIDEGRDRMREGVEEFALRTQDLA